MKAFAGVILSKIVSLVTKISSWVLDSKGNLQPVWHKHEGLCEVHGLFGTFGNKIIDALALL